MTRTERNHLVKQLGLIAEHSDDMTSAVILSAMSELRRLSDADKRAWKATSRMTAIEKLIKESKYED